MSKITMEAVEAAKQQHGQVYVVEVNMQERTTLDDLEEDTPKTMFDTSGMLADDCGEQIFRAIVRKPDKRVIGLSMTSKDPIQMGNVILKNCIIQADDEILQNDDVNITAALQVMKFISIGQGTLKKF